MYLHIQKKENGDKYLAIKEKYHVPGIGSRERTVKTIGYLSALVDQYDDPIAHFQQRAKELTEEKKQNAKKNIQTMALDMAETMEIGTDDVRNVGYLLLRPGGEKCSSAQIRSFACSPSPGR